MTTLDTALDDTSAPAAVHDIDQLLRDRPALLARIEAGDELPRLARAMITTIAVAGAVFGGAIGAYRGGLQLAYAALKLPLVLLLTACVCAPALTAINAALDRRADLRRDLALLLSSLALGSLALAAEAPLMLLAANFHLDYHEATLLLVGCCAVAGLLALGMLVRGLGRERRGASAGLVVAIVCALVGAQMSWTLRPYLVRPRSPSVTLVRDFDSSLFESVRGSLRSAMGDYDRDHAPLPGEVMRSDGEEQP